MIIPIQLETVQPEKLAAKQDTRIVPIVISPQDYAERGNRKNRESTFGDILIPALKKYVRLRDSERKDFEFLLAKENPLKIESFKNNDDKYELQVNVKKFRPDEIRVKITDDWISILGEHEEKADKLNYSKQEFLRRYSLPARVNANEIQCELSSDGYLLITAPKIDQSVKITEIPVSQIESAKAI